MLSRPSELLTYSSDGLPTYRKKPSLAVFPDTRDQLIRVVRLLAAEGVPFVARGAGTGLSAGDWSMSFPRTSQFLGDHFPKHMPRRS